MPHMLGRRRALCFYALQARSVRSLLAKNNGKFKRVPDVPREFAATGTNTSAAGFGVLRKSWNGVLYARLYIPRDIRHGGAPLNHGVKKNLFATFFFEKNKCSTFYYGNQNRNQLSARPVGHRLFARLRPVHPVSKDLQGRHLHEI